jgi:hypothetical protein
VFATREASNFLQTRAEEFHVTIDPISLTKLFLDALKLLDGKFTDHDQREYTKLLRALTDFRLLTSANEAEYAGAVISSAQNLRELFKSAAQALPQKSGLERGTYLLLGAHLDSF